MHTHTFIHSLLLVCWVAFKHSHWHQKNHVWHRASWSSRLGLPRDKNTRKGGQCKGPLPYTPPRITHIHEQVRDGGALPGWPGLLLSAPPSLWENT